VVACENPEWRTATAKKTAMRVRLLPGCVCLFVLGASATAEEKPAGDEKTIQGTWETKATGKPAEPNIVCERVVSRATR
jgi:hypothetical protein